MKPEPTPSSFETDRGERFDGLRIGPVDVVFGAAHGKYPDGNHVLVHGTDVTVSFDLPRVARACGPRRLAAADLVVLSHVHEDHTAALDLLAGVPLHVHERDVEAVRSLAGLSAHYGYGEPVTSAVCRRAVDEFHYVPRPDAIAYADGHVWDLGGGVRVRAVHAPGHTRGHSILLVEPHGIAFIADIDLSTFGPYYGDATSDLAEFRATLGLVRRLDASCWITSHHKGVVTRRDKFDTLLDTFEAALERREQAILRSLKTAPKTLDELVRERFVYPVGYEDLWVEAVEARTIAQHLAELVTSGRAAVDGPRFAAA